MYYIRVLIPILSLTFLFACQAEVKKKEPIKWSKEESINMNAAFSEEEEEFIESYLKRRPDWKMTKTGTGLRYFIYQRRDNDDSVKIGDIVTVEFTVELLDGTVCYSSEAKGAESFIVEKTDIESGINEGVKKMKLDERGKFILPSHLAHGLIGDRDKIPPLETVIYDIKLINIKPQ